MALLASGFIFLEFAWCGLEMCSVNNEEILFVQ